jgi:hypothetical protein
MVMPPLEAELRERLKREPFEPFRLILKDGRQFDIRSPHISRARIRFFDIGIPSSVDPEWIAERFLTVNYDEIARVEASPTPEPVE